MFTAEQLVQERARLYYVVADDESTWARRVEAAVTFLESHAELPREPLDRALVNKKVVPVGDRLEYLRRAVHSRAREFMLTNGRPAAYTRTGVPIERGHVSIRGSLAPDAAPLWEMSVHCPGLRWEQHACLFAALGDLLGAYVGQVTPAAPESVLAAYSMATVAKNAMSAASWYRQAKPLLDLLEEHRLQLPTLAMSRSDRLRAAPWQPAGLGWINYWSAPTCEYLGFPQAGRDDDVLRWSERTPAGAWLVKLTAEPLDVTNLEHVRTLANVYARLPGLGIRVPV